MIFWETSPGKKIKKGAFLINKDLVWPLTHTKFAAPRRRFELHVFKMVAKIRGFFGSYSKFYVGKFLLQFMKIKNISRQSLKIQISSPTVFTMRMRKINFGA